jgi:hypothetical protein
MAMTCTSVLVVAGSATLLFRIPIVCGHDGDLLTVILDFPLEAGNGGTLFVGHCAGLVRATWGSDCNGFDPFFSKSTVLTRRKALGSSSATSCWYPFGGVVVALFARVLMHGLSGRSRLRVFGFANAFARSGSELERTAVDLIGLGLVGVGDAPTVGRWRV